MYTYTRKKNYRSYMDILHIKWLLYYWRCLFSVLEVDVRYKWWVVAPNMHSSFLSKGHNLCILTGITWKLQVIYEHSAYWTTAILSETFFVWFSVSWEIRLESYSNRHTLFVLWYNTVCLYCKPVHTLLFGVQLCVATNLTYLMTAYYTPNNTFNGNDASFYKNKAG